MSVAQRINGVLRNVPAWPIYLIGPLPGIWVFWLAVGNQLGADPLAALEHQLGEDGLRFIILALLITPLRRFLGINLLKFRRAIGLMAFAYVFAHMAVWVVIDRGLVWEDIIAEIAKRRYILFGMLGFVLMIPLAITSNNLSVRRLGALTWRRIHKLTYVVAVAGVAHYLLLVKSWPLEPIIYAVIVAILLLLRIQWRRPRQQVR